jgi:hypothetical protein
VSLAFLIFVHISNVLLLFWNVESFDQIRECLFSTVYAVFKFRGFGGFKPPSSLQTPKLHGFQSLGGGVEPNSLTDDLAFQHHEIIAMSLLIAICVSEYIIWQKFSCKMSFKILW